ncbi:MAG: FKBP-type peptidyl-prolyl cis-trans isomerase [Marinilabiliales bacterium]
MKSILIILFVGTLFLISCNQENGDGNSEASNVVLQTKADSMDYAIGILLANDVKKQGITINNPDILSKAFNDIISESDLAFSFEEANNIIQNYYAEQSEKNKIAGEEFLAENAKKEGVITLENGIQYEVLKEGTGKQPNDSSNVTVHYTGTLIDGRVFDSSVERGQPIQFNVRDVIQGWREILPLMKEGAKWKVYIPQELAYGANPRPGGIIEPYMALIFEIELISVDD